MSSSFAPPLPLGPADSFSETICQVLTPHPSYRLLLLSSSVLLHNSSGIPLELCFLDEDLNPLLLPAAHGMHASLQAVGEAPPPATGGRLANEEPSSSHPELNYIPPWLLQRERRWKEQQRRVTQQQKEQLKLLLQDATVNAAASKRPGDSPPPLRRAATDALGIASFRRSPSSKASSLLQQHLQHQAHQQQQQREWGGEQEPLLHPATTQQLLARFTYTFLLPDQHVLSVPQRAIIGAGWCNVCFRPAAFAEGPAAGHAAAPAAAAGSAARAPQAAEGNSAAVEDTSNDEVNAGVSCFCCNGLSQCPTLTSPASDCAFLCCSLGFWCALVERQTGEKLSDGGDIVAFLFLFFMPLLSLLRFSPFIPFDGRPLALRIGVAIWQ